MKKVSEQPDLFTSEEYEDLNTVIQRNYRDKFEQSRYIFSQDDEPEDIAVSDTESKHRVLQESIFDSSELQQMTVQVKEKQEREAREAKAALEKAVVDAQRKMILPYYPDPKNDNELLLNLQYEYCKTGSQKAWGDLLINSTRVLHNLMKNYTVTHKVYLDDIEQSEKISIALLYVMRRYKERVGWCVKKNFISALRDGLFNHAMKYKTMADSEVSYEEKIKCRDTR